MTISRWPAKIMKIPISIACLIVGLIAVFAGLALVAAQGFAMGADSLYLTGYSNDPVPGTWFKTGKQGLFSHDLKAVAARGTNTVIIRVLSGDPVKDITIENALVVGGNEPIIEIAGQANGAGIQGHLNIGALSFTGVDARRLTIDATEAVLISTAGAVDRDDELDVNVTAVGVVPVAPGGTTRFTIGSSNPDDPAGGVRIDRIRILGPEGGTGFIEKLTVNGTGAVGNIQVTHVRAQSITLDAVSLDDGVP